MTISACFTKPQSWLSSWLSVLFLAVITTACGGSGGSGDEGREPILGIPSASLVALSISPLTSSIPIGGMQQYVATASYADGSSRLVTSESTWTSSVITTAKISTSGAAQGVVAGSVVISATFADKTATASLIILPATLTSMTITPLNPSIPAGTQQVFKTTGTYSDGTSSDITAITTFSTANTSVATISASGIATGLIIGATPVLGSSGGLSSTTILTVTSATLVNIAIAPINPTLQIGATQALTVTATYTDGTSLPVTASSIFSANAPAIAKVVSTTGIVTAMSAGVSVMSALFNGMTVSTNVTVAPAQLVSIAVTPATASILVTGTQAFTAMGTYTDGSTVDISNAVIWTSSDITKATILPTGVATGLAAGTSVMTASLNGKSGNGSLTVTVPVTLSSIAITPKNATIISGATQSYSAIASYSNGTTLDVSTLATWSSSDTNVATIMPTAIASGLIAGSTTISATYQSKTDSGVLTVNPAVSLVSIAVAPLNSSIVQGATLTYSAVGTYSDSSTANITNLVTWSSSQVSIASINSLGVATGLTPGLSVISAVLSGKTGSANLTVTAPVTLVSIVVTPNNPSASVGETQQFTATATYSDLSTVNISNTATWSSSNALIATIMNSAPKGLATAVSEGVTVITATQGAISGNTNLNVTAAVVTGINLGAATNFGVLAGNSITNNSGGLTLVTGDVGSPSQTVDPVQVAGFTNYKSGAILTNALADLQVAIADANSRTCTVSSASGIDLGGLTLPPGVYCYAGAITITGTFTMSGPGLYIFRTTSTLDSASNSVVALTSGASSGNVFWVPSAATTLGASSAFIGTVVGSSAAITMGDMATLQNGRVLSGSAVTLRNNVITR